MARAASADVSDGDVLPGGRRVVLNLQSPPPPLVGCTLLDAGARTAAGALVLCVVSVAVEGALGDIPSTEPVFRELDVGTTPAAAGGVAVAGTALGAQGDCLEFGTGVWPGAVAKGSGIINHARAGL